MSGIANYPRATIEVTAGTNGYLQLKEPKLRGGSEKLYVRTEKFADYFKFTVLVNQETQNIWISSKQLVEKFSIVPKLAELASELDQLILILFFKTVVWVLFQHNSTTSIKQHLLTLATEQCKERSFAFSAKLYNLPQRVYITPTFIGYAIKHSLIGQGSYAKVKLAKDLNQNVFALRVCHLDGSNAEEIAREYKGLEELRKLQNNPGVIDLLGSYIYKERYRQTFITVHTYCPTSNLPIQGLSPQTQWHYANELLRTLANLEIAHGDLKRANIVIDKDDQIKLIDFSFCRRAGDTNFQPAAPYLAPECYTSPNPPIKTLDVWPAALILWELFSENVDVYNWLRSDDPRLTEEVITEELNEEERFSPELKKLLTNMLIIDPTKRWERQFVYAWFQENIPPP